MNRILLLLLIVIPSLINAQSTVVDIVVNSNDHNTLEAAVLAAGLEDDLAEDGPFTLFAPTDAAFEALGADLVNSLLENPDGALTNVLLNHVVNGSVASSSLSDGQVVPSLFGDDITVAINADGVFVNGAKVTVVDLMATNGIVHVVDAVIVPSSNFNTITDIVTSSPDHTTLQTALEVSGLNETLNGDTELTLFAPTDAAFEALGADLINNLVANPDGALTNVLLNHVVNGSVASSSLSDGQVVPSLFGDDITVAINADGVFVNGAKVTVVDLMATNGIVHVVDAVIVPSSNFNTITDIVTSSPDHTTLQTALEVSGLNETLNGDTELTLFAPTDAAFELLPDGTLDALLADKDLLTSVLLYHATGGSVLDSDLSDGQRITTLDGRDAIITINADGAFINEAKISVTNLQATNGIVHVIDAVILAGNSIFDIVAASADHTILETAIRAVGLEDIISNEDITLYAPTDEAFSKLPAGTLDFLVANPDVLTQILATHALEGEFESDEFIDEEIPLYLTLNGYTLTITNEAGSYAVNDIAVDVADVEAENGILNVINTVILNPDSTVLNIVDGSADHTILSTMFDSTYAEVSTIVSSYGPYTLFAPANVAFDDLTQADIDALLADEDAISDILGDHLVYGTALSTDLSDGMVLTTLSDIELTVTINTDGVFINDAKVTTADLLADNGVVHVLDGILSESSRTVLDIIQDSPDHTTLATAISLADLEGVLSGDDEYTVFAPTDDAFAALPAGVLDALIMDPDGALRTTLLYHVTAGTALSGDLSNGQVIMMANGEDVAVTINSDGVFINNAKVTVVDLQADNGVVHVIDAVISPSVNSDDLLIVNAEVYPNPVNDVLSYNIEDVTNDPVDLTLTNNQGMVIYRLKSVTSTGVVHLNDVPSGAYMLTLKNNEVSATSRIVKI